MSTGNNCFSRLAGFLRRLARTVRSAFARTDRRARRHAPPERRGPVGREEARAGSREVERGAAFSRLEMAGFVGTQRQPPRKRFLHASTPEHVERIKKALQEHAEKNLIDISDSDVVRSDSDRFCVGCEAAEKKSAEKDARESEGLK